MPYVPSYSVPIPTYQPAMRVIAGITNSFPVVITTTIDHLYISGTIVRIDIPIGFGMQQLNQQTGTIIILSSTTFSMAIDTTSYDTFQLPTVPPGNQDAQVVPIGEDNDLLRAAVQNVLPFSTL